MPLPDSPAQALDELNAEVVVCTKCPRLVEWRQRVAREKRASFADWTYWGRPVPGWGDPEARILVVGLAPAAHGGNRTGRVFTGDRSGDWLFASMYRCGLANQPTSTHRDDGLKLTDIYISAVVKCAPPANKPTIDERDNCIPYFVREMDILPNVKVMIALGSFGWDGALRVWELSGHPRPRPKPRFGHLAEVDLGGVVLVGSYHPSQQNTFTGKLTEEMMDAVFHRARELTK